MTTNFLIFDENKVNMQAQGDYLVEDYRLNGAETGIAPASIHNKLFRQLSVMVAALGEFLSDSGENVSDDDYAALVTSMHTVWGGVSIPTGTIRTTLQPSPASGWIFAYGTIGSAASNATNRANADTLALFSLIWDNTNSSAVPIYNSSGVATTRGASAAADFAANKAISIDFRGHALAAKDNMGGTAASIVTSAATNGGNAVNLMGKAGAQTHTLQASQIPANLTGTAASSGSHTHSGSTSSKGNHRHDLELETSAGSGGYYTAGSVPFKSGRAIGRSLGFAADADARTSSNGRHSHSLSVNSGGSHTHSVTINTSGGGNAHNNVQPTIFVNVEVKL